MIFAGMPLTFQPERARGVAEVYQYRIEGRRGGTWTIGVNDGALAVSRGATAEPSVVFDIGDEDFIRLVTGQVEAMELLTTGRLRITGSLQRAAMFQSFFVPIVAEAKPA
jgi:alkyl sulfatase BDS1-like metallo-beta-lactamase superfamily hydrolase